VAVRAPSCSPAEALSPGSRLQPRHNKPTKPTNQPTNQPHINILGVKLNNKWQLLDARQSANDNLIKVKGITQKLRHLFYLDVIDKKSRWISFIDSLLISRIIHNNMPIFCIDARAIKWADSLISKCLKSIANVSKYASINMINTIFNFKGAIGTIMPQIIRRRNSEHYWEMRERKRKRSERKSSAEKDCRMSSIK